MTGAGRGLGAAMALALAQAGASVLLWGRKPAGLRATAERIAALGRACWIDRVDVTDAAAVRRAVQRALRRAPIDILVNNAGIWDGDPLTRLSLPRWRRVLETDLTAAFAVSQAVAPAMIRRRRGAILHISSVSAFLAHREGSAYCTAKAGLVQLTRVMAVELGPSGIRVNAIAPGTFPTGMTADLFADRAWVRRRLRKLPLRRFGQPEDLAGLVVFLASDAARHITGHTVVIDGGASLLVG